MEIKPLKDLTARQRQRETHARPLSDVMKHLGCGQTHRGVREVNALRAERGEEAGDRLLLENILQDLSSCFSCGVNTIGNNEEAALKT